jgi:S-adenosylmethionine synthetase
MMEPVEADALFNDWHETGGGHLVQARFGSKPVRGDRQFAQLLRYVARNPVRAGLCERPENGPGSVTASS